MALQICPNCKANSFTWYINDEEYLLKIWTCHTCDYKAFENETLERVCSSCYKKTESSIEDEVKKTGGVATVIEYLVLKPNKFSISILLLTFQLI